MNLFRSEGHLARWLDGGPSGATLGISRLNQLAEAWWGDRLDSDWRPHTRLQNQRILDRLGLVGDFWLLP